MTPTMMAVPKKRSGPPIWIWAVIGVVLLAVVAGGGFMLFGRGPTTASTPTLAPVAAALTQQAATVTRAASKTPVPPYFIKAVGVMPPGFSLLSDNKLYRFEVHADGELVLYDNYSSKTMWSSKSKGEPNALVMQDDGNLVLYAKNGSVIWATNKTGKKGDYYLQLQDDGNLVVYQGIAGTEVTPIWASNTAR